MCGKHFPPSPAKLITSLPPNVTSGASLRTCAPHSPSAQRRAETVEFGPFMGTQQYQCIKVLVETRDTSAKQFWSCHEHCNQLQSLFCISKRYKKVWIDTNVIASLFLDLNANTVIMQRSGKISVLILDHCPMSRVC